MRWDAVELARFARAAGFHRDDVPTAAALALATSGGIDTYDVMPGSPGSGHYVGLWGVDVDEWPEYLDWTWHDPRQAATMAHDLTQLHDGFGWSAVHHAGHHQPYVAHAATEATREVDAQAVPRTRLTLHRGRSFDELAHQLHRARQARYEPNMTRGW